MMDRVKTAAPLKGFVSFDDEEASQDAEAETLTGMEIPPHMFEQHTE